MTPSGHLVSATDAATSLKRNIALGKGGHGDLRRFLCPDHRLRELTDECPGIEVDGDHLILRVVDPSLLPLFIPTLESADFSIVPASNIGGRADEFRILNYPNRLWLRAREIPCRWHDGRSMDSRLYFDSGKGGADQEAQSAAF